MLTTLGMILLGFAGFSAAFILFVFLFGDKGTFLNLTATGGAPLGFPVETFPTTAGAAQTGATAILDIELTTLGQVFITGGMFATAILAIMMFISPWSVLNKCRVCEICACPEPACPTGCAQA